MLFNAIECNDLQAVADALEKGAEVNATNERGETALRVASIYDTRFTALLLQKGANVKDRQSELALFKTIMDGELATAKLLIEYGVNVNTRGPYNPFTGNDGPSMLAAAIMYDGRGTNQNGAILSLLIEHGVNIHSKNEDGEIAWDDVVRWYREGITRQQEDAVRSCEVMIRLLIPPMLLKDPEMAQPDDIQSHQELSATWENAMKEITWLKSVKFLDSPYTLYEAATRPPEQLIISAKKIVDIQWDKKNKKIAEANNCPIYFAQLQKKWAGVLVTAKKRANCLDALYVNSANGKYSIHPGPSQAERLQPTISGFVRRLFSVSSRKNNLDDSCQKTDAVRLNADVIKVIAQKLSNKDLKSLGRACFWKEDREESARGSYLRRWRVGKAST